MKQWLDRAFLLGLFAALIAVPFGVWKWGRTETLSYYENRSLAAYPKATAEALTDGSFGSDYESWLSDHMPGRTTLLKLDTRVQMNVLRRPTVNDVTVQKSVLLSKPVYTDYTAEDYVEKGSIMAARFGKLAEHISANGGIFCYVGFPEQENYFQDCYPAYSRAGKAALADPIFAELLAENGVDFLDMAAEYDRLGHPAEFYSTVDHHYNYYGAYTAYRTILAHLAERGCDLPVLTEEDIDLVPQPYPYIGSRNRKLYNLWPNGEQAVIGVQKEPVAFTRTDNGQPSSKPLFVLPAEDYLPTTYNLYMGGDFAETVMETNRPDLPKALIFGDSFTNALETLLYTAFDETHILDLRHYTDKSLKDYITDYQPDVVLCILNDTFYYTATGNGAVWEDPQ